MSFAREVFLLRVLQHLRQLRIAAVIRQDEDLWNRLALSARRWVVRRPPLAPTRPRLQPEDLCHDVAPLRSEEQRAGDRRIGLRRATIEFITKALAQCLRRAADELGDVVLRDTETRQVRTFSRSASFTTKAVLAICSS